VKRSDIKPGEVYGYTEDRAHIYRYSAVIVLSTDLYMISRFARHEITRAPAGSKPQRGRSYNNTIGLLTVFLDAADHDTVRKVRALASVQDALEGMQGLNGRTREITDGINAQTGQPVVLGRYGMLTQASYLHGDYYELTAALEARQTERQRLASEAEQGRKDAVAARNELADRLDAPGSRFSIKVADLEELLNLAELGAAEQTRNIGG
jgi:hypothetical protein